MNDRPRSVPSKSTRRSLTHVGGEAETWGDPKARDALASALAVLGAEAGGEESARAHVHGFHTYPARLHPDTASRLVASFSPDGGTVLDPFCGSGTVVVESLVAGRNAFGTDLNPLAILLARVKTSPMAQGEAEAIVEAARAIAERADERRKAKAGATRRLPQDDVALFPPHVLLELDSLRDGIEKLDRGPVQDALWVVLASQLVKVSKKRGDTAQRGEGEKRVASGFTLRFFVKKAEDLSRRRAELAAKLGDKRPKSRIALDDASELRTVAAGSIDAIVSSPPYANTYDYLEHHALRMRWLGLEAKGLARGELGARRAYARLEPEEAREKWVHELERFLKAASRVTKIGGNVVLVIGDSAIRAHRGDAVALRADEMIGEAADHLPLEPIARASQPRPHFHDPTASAFRKRARHEHALLLRRTKR